MAKRGPRAPSKAEQLSASERQKLSDLLLNGATLDQAALQFGLTRSCINRYKHRVILPALASAKYAVNQAVKEQVEQHAVQHAATREIATKIAVGSPLRDRLNSLWNRIDKYIEDPKVTDKAPLINQAHKNLELLGRATGELNDSNRTNGSSMQIMQVLMLPVTPAPEPAKIVDAGATCDSDDSSS
jgi:hypothetical protein